MKKKNKRLSAASKEASPDVEGAAEEKKENTESKEGCTAPGTPDADGADNQLTSKLVSAELKRERNKLRFKRLLKSTVYGLVIVAAIAALIATLVLPVIQISGDSMDPTLKNGDIVVLVKTTKLERGDLCAFYHSNKILIKRVVGLPGDEITLDGDGNVFINGYALEEPYVSERGLGECDIEFPYTVPENQYFVMGDHRESSIDSRSSVIGCVAYDVIMGKILFTVWPLESFGVPS